MLPALSYDQKSLSSLRTVVMIQGCLYYRLVLLIAIGFFHLKLVYAFYVLHISSLITLQLLIDNISRPAPNVTHLLLKFDLDSSIEHTLLQPKFHYRLHGLQAALVMFIHTFWKKVCHFSPIFICELIAHLQLLKGYSWNIGQAFEAWCECIALWIWLSG